MTARAPTDACSPTSCDGIVAWAGVDWWYHPHGHSECQLMSRLARRVPVLWVNSIGMRAPTPGKTQMLLQRYAWKLKSTFQGLRQDASGMWVYSPVFVPRYTPRVLELNGRLLAMQIGRLCRRLGIRRPSTFVTVPTVAPALRHRKWTSIVFNRCDDFAAFPEADASLISGLEQRIFDAADHVVYVNDYLFQRERDHVNDARYLGHGVDYEHFARSRASGNGRRGPTAIRDLPRPIVGFYGSIEDYRVDLELLIKVARHIAPGTLLLIGPKTMDISRLEAEPNVTYLGPLPHDQLPAYAVEFDVGLMPFTQNEFTANINPIKLKEYLALGFPIVATKFPAITPYAELVHVADSPDEFTSKVDAALHENDVAMIEKRRHAVAGDSWDALAERVAELLCVEPESRRS